MVDVFTPEQRAELRKLAEAATPGPWAFAYSGILSVPKVITEEEWWTEERMNDGHSYDHRVGQVCEACGPRFVDGTMSQMWDCAFAGEALDQDHTVARVQPSYGDTATGQRAADAEFIAAAREAVPVLLDEVERLTKHNAELKILADEHPHLWDSREYWQGEAARLTALLTAECQACTNKYSDHNEFKSNCRGFVADPVVFRELQTMRQAVAGTGARAVAAETALASVKSRVQDWDQRSAQAADGVPTTLAWVVADLDIAANFGLTPFTAAAVSSRGDTE